MPKKQLTFKNRIASLITLLLMLGLSALWMNFRELSLRGLDIFFIGVGLASLLWIKVWMRSKNASKQPLIIPWAPIFIVPLVGILAPQLNLLSDFEGFNMIVFFYLGFMATVAIMGLFNLFSTWYK